MASSSYTSYIFIYDYDRTSTLKQTIYLPKILFEGSFVKEKVLTDL